MTQLAETSLVGSHLTCSPILRSPREGSMTPRKPKRPSEEADPADLVPQEYEEPSGDASRELDKAEFE